VKLLRPLRERDFALLWTGMTVSLLGDGIYLVAVAWQVYDLSDDPAALALVGLAWTSGMVAFLLFGGIVSDRVERRRVMIAADLVRAAVLAAIGALSVAGVLQVWHLAVLVVLFGAGEAFFGPAFSALIPDILTGERLVDANALEQLVREGAATLLGPAVGGAVVALVGAGTAFLIDAGTFLFSAGCILALRVRSVQVGRAARSARREIGEGVAFARSQPWLWATLVMASVSLLAFMGPLDVLVPYVIRNDLGSGAGAFGAVLAAGGAGSVAASIVLSQRGLPRRYLTFMYSVWGGGTLAFVGYAFATHVWHMAVLAVVFGASDALGMIVWRTLMQTRVPPELRGRVTSLDWFVSIALAPLSFALTGPVSSAIGVDATLILAGIVPAVVTAVLFFAADLRADEAAHPAVPTADVVV